MQGLGVEGGFRIGGVAHPFLDLLPPAGLPFLGNPLSWRALVPASTLRVVLVAAMLFVGAMARAATTTYTSVYAGGTIAPGNTVLLNNGSTVTGNVVANGTLQFNQTGTTLTISNTISGTGTLSLTNTGTVVLTASAFGTNTYASDMSNSVTSGRLTVGATGSGTLYMGVSGTGALTLNGGNVTTGTGYVGGFYAGSSGAVTVSSGTWTNSGNLTIGGNPNNNFIGTGALTISGRGVVVVGGTLSKGVYGTINLNRGGTLQIGTGTTGGVLLGETGSLFINGALIFNRSGDSTYSGAISGGGSGSVRKQGVGTLTLSGSNSYAGGTTISGGMITVPLGGEINHSIASMIIGSSAGESGSLSLIGGYINAGAGFVGSIPGSNGTATISSGTWSNRGNLEVGVSGTGTLTMSGGLVTVGGTLSKGTYGAINLQAGGTLQIGTGGTTGVLGVTMLNNNGTLVFNRSDDSAYSGVISGTGTIQNAGEGTTTLTGQTSFTNGLIATVGRLIVGSASSVTGFSTTGSLAAASGATLELKSKGLAYVNGLSTLTGGTILAANGISLGGGSNIMGTGAISGDVSAVYGSWIEADGGKLTVGNTSSYVGFASDGRLYTNANEVELLDRNLAVLGSLTQLGVGSAGGTLRAANGMLLEQGKNLVGCGTVYGNFVNQGDVYGDGSTTGQEIVFAAGSTVSGNGSFTNALFQGTYSPGNSPAITNLQDGGFAQTSTLLIEVGGTQAGSQYDQVQDASTLSLRGGSLSVVLTNSFVPAPGNSFQILRYGQLSGDFGAMNLPAFANGLGWQRLTTGTSMTLVAAPSAVNIDVAAGSKTLAAAGYSSLVFATSLSKSGAGALVLNSPNTLTGPTTIQQGTLKLAHSSALAASTISPLAGGVLSLTPSLQTTVGGLDPNAGGLVDVGNGYVTVANGLSQLGLVSALQSGRAGGSWTGSSGITSSAAASAMANSTLRSVGWLDNGNGSVSFAFAAPGDSNLDWTVDILDASNFLSFGKFDTGLPATWIEGDFNYDNSVDILDAADFFAAGLYDAGGYNAPASLVPVPEPSASVWCGLGLAFGAWVIRRR
jgi:fibronectin-binding autotransporter adhesin